MMLYTHSSSTKTQPGIIAPTDIRLRKTSDTLPSYRHQGRKMRSPFKRKYG